MDFSNLIRIANKNEVQAEKKRSTLKPGLPPPPSTSKKDSKPAKGINSAAVRAVLAEQERLEREKAQKVKQKPSGPTKDAASAPKAPPPVKPCAVDDDLDCDLKKLFNKNSKRVPHVPDSSIPNMLEVLKEKERLRKQKEKEEDEERIRRERELLRERGEREREKQREEKEKAHHHSSDGSSKHKHRSHHHSDQRSFVSSTSPDNKSSSSNQRGQFKIPKKPPMSYDDILAMAAKKQDEPEASASAAPVTKKPVATASKPEPGRLMTQAEKDRWARINSEEYQNWLKNGGPPPKNLPQTSKSKSSSSLNKDKVSSNSQLDKRKTGQEELVGSRSDRCKINDKSRSPDRGRAIDRAGAVNGQVKVTDRSQSNGHTKQNGVRSSTLQLSSDRSNRVETTSSSLSESQRKSNDQVSGIRKDQKSSEINRQPVKPPVGQKDLPVKGMVNEKNVKGVVNEKNVDVSKSNSNLNRRPQDSGRLKSNGNDTKANNSGPSSTGGGGGGGCQKEHIMKDFYIQCKKLKESGFLSDSLLKSLENELREKLKSLRKGDTSNAIKPTTSGNNSRPLSDKLSAKPSASHSQQDNSKVKASNSKAKSSLGVSNSSSLKRDEKPDSKSVSVWDKICAENRQFKPKLNPAVLKRRLEEHDSEEDEDDEYNDDDDDMDSFIDDGEDDGGTDYTTYIRSMTKYDPTKYDDDFDDPNMEASYTQVLKEEAFSAREGRREDIQDMLMEEEENRRKLLKKKSVAKRARFS